ncbi:MAG TPA: hypothetical protein VH852_07720 [Hyphomicrobium sp.]|jgi:hypothetical protein
MRRTLLLGVALALTSPLMLGQASAAGTAVPHMKWAQSAASEGAIVEKAGWRCRKWRHKCAWRWGVGTRRYYRCLWRHGC